MWNPLSSVFEKNPTEGIIRLWHSPNYFDNTPWSTFGVESEDLFYFFFIPAGFSFVTVDTFQFNFGFKYVNRSEEVNGFVVHNGKHDLQQGKTVPFWHLDEQSPIQVKIQTDDDTKLPYLITPDVGDPHYKAERRYFIPVTPIA